MVVHTTKVFKFGVYPCVCLFFLYISRWGGLRTKLNWCETDCEVGVLSGKGVANGDVKGTGSCDGKATPNCGGKGTADDGMFWVFMRGTESVVDVMFSSTKRFTALLLPTSPVFTNWLSCCSTCWASVSAGHTPDHKYTIIQRIRWRLF